MFLVEQELTELIAWRHELHASRSYRGRRETAQTVQAFLRATGADKVITGLGRPRGSRDL